MTPAPAVATSSDPSPAPAPMPSRRRRRVEEALGVGRAPSRRARLGAALAIFVLALAIRSLYALDLAPLMYTRAQPGTRMAWRYDEAAVGILEGEGVLWPRHPDPARTGLLARPPGYPLFLALVYRALGRSFFAAQLVQNVLTSLACVLLVLAAARLVSWRVGIGGGLIAALSPHLASSSSFLVSDALSAVPLLAAIALLARAHPDGRARWWTSGLAGVLIGAGAWLRPNVMLLAPFLGALIVLAARDRRRALGHALALTAAAAAVIAPITVRNYAVFGEFIPLSINGGLTLWQGVTDAGGEGQGARRRDKLVMDEEAERYGNPRYREWWAEPDGIFRDRERYRRAREVIRAHPLLYARVVAGRMAEMLRYAAPGPPRLDGSGMPSLRAPDADDEPSDLRTHDLARRPEDAAFLGWGRALEPLRPVLAVAQGALMPALTPLALLGAAVLLARRWRSALLLLALPLYYLSTESFFLYEWRVAVPMHYPLFACAAAPAVLVVGLARSAWGRRPAQNQAG